MSYAAFCRFLLVCLLSTLFWVSPATAELPKQVQHDKYMLTLMDALKKKDYQAALPYFEKLEALGLPLSDSFYYFKGEALAKTRHPVEAEQAINQYIKKTGTKGKYYKNALEVLVEIEPALEAERDRIAREKAAEAARLKAEQEAKAKEAQQVAALKAKLPSLNLDADLVAIPKGCFQMGSPEDEKDRSSNEGPQREVCLESFKIGRHEVTQGLWQAVIGENPSSFKSGDNYPVERVSWDDIQLFLKRLNAASGKQYRLPSEAQWEYAARAGTTTAYLWNATEKKGFFGNHRGISHDNANYGKDECCGGLAKGKDQWENTSPVGSFDPNPWGLYDTAGNVWEWVRDCYGSYNDAPTDGSAQEGGPCEYRVARGGSWFNDPAWLRSAGRFWTTASSLRSYDLGFRLAHD